ncbi:MAG: hypothetical protein J7M19_09555 [Planctomycetes bacterium]|nr:hypothetical protein [Planctomycetota bacterium]
MKRITNLFKSDKMSLAGKEGAAAARRIAQAAGLTAYTASLVSAPGGAALLVRTGVDKSLLLAASKDSVPGWMGEFSGRIMTAAVDDEPLSIRLCPLTHENAVRLRKRFPYTAPRCFGVKTAAGMGDRLGIATPGHVRAVRGTGVVPFLAQQSIREMTRTDRRAKQVMDDASWGVFQEGWTEGFGSDADHLKTTADIDTCIAAGFTMYTVDPSDHVDNSADTCAPGELSSKFDSLDWNALETSSADMKRDYLSGEILLPGDVALQPTEAMLVRAAVKYSAASAHTATMFRYLADRMGEKPFELEMSVDETETPTSTFEHYFVARELRRLGVKWVSLAPRFVGDFEKGIDYKGDVKVFEKSFAEQVAVMKEFGPYKISIHSGSDKFSIYPAAARLAEGLVHLKTAGTSYLEALRVIARIAPALFREILAFAFEHYDSDKASYHVSADPAKVPAPQDAGDDELDDILNGNDGRQLLHVTYGSVLMAKVEGHYVFRDRLLMALRSNEEAYYEVLEGHLGRHIAPFAQES